VAVAGQQ
jgi:cobalamin biosynthesis Mg chelatase CobN